ncbi:hypothetical protein NEDG_00593 [Nematocida displodere]|uniref:Spindle assembly abnormal protein 6 N-terminal domain-containing protein n=1 Tax=Nematocida displodere TaxID=1805483 RepID=A0A177EDJ1_9MICR|nr:hypothetical protein NEDG_00593 [Nematocida displodere]
MTAREILFSERVKVHHEGVSKEFKCELIRTHRGIEVRMYDQSDIFNILISRIEESEYYRIKEVQGIRVDYFVFVKKLVEMLEKVAENRLLLSLTEHKAAILERSDFKNIVQIELPLTTMPEAQFRRYVAEVVNDLQLASGRAERELSSTREEAERRGHLAAQTQARLEEELREVSQKFQALLATHRETEQQKNQHQSQGQNLGEELGRYRALYENLQSETARKHDKMQRVEEIDTRLREAERKSRMLEEDLKKANEIIKRTFDDVKEKKRTEAALKEEIEELSSQKKELEQANAQLEGEVLERREEIRMHEEMERERKEVIGSLKLLNRSLTKRLDSTYRVYTNLYGRTAADPLSEEDTMRTDDTTSSIVVPETLHY